MPNIVMIYTKNLYKAQKKKKQELQELFLYFKKING